MTHDVNHDAREAEKAALRAGYEPDALVWERKGAGWYVTEDGHGVIMATSWDRRGNATFYSVELYGVAHIHGARTVRSAKHVAERMLEIAKG